MAIIGEYDGRGDHENDRKRSVGIETGDRRPADEQREADTHDEGPDRIDRRWSGRHGGLRAILTRSTPFDSKTQQPHDRWIRTWQREPLIPAESASLPRVGSPRGFRGSVSRSLVPVGDRPRDTIGDGFPAVSGRYVTSSHNRRYRADFESKTKEAIPSFS